jgi:antitoxin component YwqK of YwqJK toxin-antitoxin module
MERNMIRHEITTIYTCEDYVYHRLTTVNRDLEYHREGDLPAYREWNYENGILWEEFYYLKGERHREGGLSDFRGWYENGILSEETYHLHGKLHRKGGLPALRRWHENGNLSDKQYWLKGRYKGKFR